MNYEMAEEDGLTEHFLRTSFNTENEAKTQSIDETLKVADKQISRKEKEKGKKSSISYQKQKKGETKQKKNYRGIKNQKKSDLAGVSPQTRNEIVEQQEEAKRREAEWTEKLKKIEAVERRELKKKNRAAKKIARKLSSHVQPPSVNLQVDQLLVFESALITDEFGTYTDNKSMTGKINTATMKDIRNHSLEELSNNKNKKGENEEHLVVDTPEQVDKKITKSRKVPSPRHPETNHELMQFQTPKHSCLQIAVESKRAVEAILIKQEPESHRKPNIYTLGDAFSYAKHRKDLRKHTGKERLRDEFEAMTVEDEKKLNVMHKQQVSMNKSWNKSVMSSNTRKQPQDSKLMPKVENPIKKGVIPNTNTAVRQGSNQWVERTAIRQLIPDSKADEEAMVNTALHLSCLTAEQEQTSRNASPQHFEKSLPSEWVKKKKMPIGKKQFPSVAGVLPSFAQTNKIFTFTERDNERNKVSEVSTENKTQSDDSMRIIESSKKHSHLCSCECNDEIQWQLEGPCFPSTSMKPTNVQNVSSNHIHGDRQMSSNINNVGQDHKSSGSRVAASNTFLHANIKDIHQVIDPERFQKEKKGSVIFPENLENSQMCGSGKRVDDIPVPNLGHSEADIPRPHSAIPVLPPSLLPSYMNYITQSFSSEFSVDNSFNYLEPFGTDSNTLTMHSVQNPFAVPPGGFGIKDKSHSVKSPLLLKESDNTTQIKPIEKVPALPMQYKTSDVWPDIPACPPVLAYSLQQMAKIKSQINKKAKTKCSREDTAQAIPDEKGNQNQREETMPNENCDAQSNIHIQDFSSIKPWKSSKYKQSIPSKLKQQMELKRKVQSLLEEIRKSKLIDSEDLVSK